MKVKHVLFLSFAIIGLLYVWHCLSMHNGQGILPGVGINVKS